MFFHFLQMGFQSLIVLDVEFIHPARIKVLILWWFLFHYGSAMLLSCLMCNIPAENSEVNMKHNWYGVLTDPNRQRSTFTPLFDISPSFLCLPRGQNLEACMSACLWTCTWKCAHRLQPIPLPPIIHFCSTGKERGWGLDTTGWFPTQSQFWPRC